MSPISSPISSPPSPPSSASLPSCAPSSNLPLHPIHVARRRVRVDTCSLGAYIHLLPSVLPVFPHLSFSLSAPFLPMYSHPRPSLVPSSVPASLRTLRPRRVAERCMCADTCYLRISSVRAHISAPPIHLSLSIIPFEPSLPARLHPRSCPPSAPHTWRETVYARIHPSLLRSFPSLIRIFSLSRPLLLFLIVSPPLYPRIASPFPLYMSPSPSCPRPSHCAPVGGWCMRTYAVWARVCPSSALASADIHIFLLFPYTHRAPRSSPLSLRVGAILSSVPLPPLPLRSTPVASRGTRIYLYPSLRSSRSPPRSASALFPSSPSSSSSSLVPSPPFLSPCPSPFSAIRYPPQMHARIDLPSCPCPAHSSLSLRLPPVFLRPASPPPSVEVRCLRYLLRSYSPSLRAYPSFYPSCLPFIILPSRLPRPSHPRLCPPRPRPPPLPAHSRLRPLRPRPLPSSIPSVEAMGARIVTSVILLRIPFFLRPSLPVPLPVRVSSVFLPYHRLPALPPPSARASPRHCLRRCMGHRLGFYAHILAFPRLHPSATRSPSSTFTVCARAPPSVVYSFCPSTLHFAVPVMLALPGYTRASLPPSFPPSFLPFLASLPCIASARSS
ncbi:hypothetical protein FB451DRAFT_178374 [Mycena latifolia]|nr:hypothetical protein FB451DRAFT_178374 [Mycena latifolia]